MIQPPFDSTIEQSQIAQKIRDREIRGIQLTNIHCYSRKITDKIHKIKYINDIIQDLERYGPAGLIHIAVLSNIIKRPIKIWNANGSLNKIIGGRKTGHSIDIEYHVTDSEEIGHWTLKGGKDPDNVIIDLNSCLFSVIGFQIGQNPLRLRKRTVLKLKNNFQNLAEWIGKIFQLEGKDRVIRMTGGANYKGTSSEDAKVILDNSQDQGSSKDKYQEGHARGHASIPETPKENWRGSVENYTEDMPGHKSAFLSSNDQDYITDLALRTRQAQEAMERLNMGSHEEVIKVSARDLKKLVPKGVTLPQINLWLKGKPDADEHDMVMVKLNLRHHINKTGDRNAEVMVHTCIPMSRVPKTYATEKEVLEVLKRKREERWQREMERREKERKERERKEMERREMERKERKRRKRRKR